MRNRKRVSHIPKLSIMYKLMDLYLRIYMQLSMFL